MVLSMFSEINNSKQDFSFFVRFSFPADPDFFSYNVYQASLVQLVTTLFFFKPNFLQLSVRFVSVSSSLSILRYFLMNVKQFRSMSISISLRSQSSGTIDVSYEFTQEINFQISPKSANILFLGFILVTYYVWYLRTIHFLNKMPDSLVKDPKTRVVQGVLGL